MSTLHAMHGNPEINPTNNIKNYEKEWTTFEYMATNYFAKRPIVLVLDWMPWRSGGCGDRDKVNKWKASSPSSISLQPSNKKLGK